MLVYLSTSFVFATSFHETMEFWHIGYKLMEGKFQHTGIVVSNASPQSYYDPVDEKNNFEGD